MKQLLLLFLVLLMEPCSSQNQEKTFSYLALGDSYTIGESVAENKRFPVQLTKKLQKAGYTVKAAKIVAVTGWTSGELAAGIKKENLDEQYDLVSLLIGVNNQYRGKDTAEYRLQFSGLLARAVGYGYGNPKNVIVLSIPDYGVTPFAVNRNPEKIAREIDAFNKINREETRKAGAYYIDITPISRNAKNDPALIAKDGLHPSGKMYARWVERIYPVADEMLKNKE